MNAKSLIAIVISIAAASSAFAQAPTSGLSREQVTAELMRARAAGEIPQSDADYGKIAFTPSTLSRAEVQAELQRARANGELAQGETDYPKLPVVASKVTRAEVAAELAAARKNGFNPATDLEQDVAHYNSARFLSPN
ncbi:hypothetical protein AAKU55_002439 [Oxalobacteraceae bacterium GrIS 1.11]